MKKKLKGKGKIKRKKEKKQEKKKEEKRERQKQDGGRKGWENRESEIRVKGTKKKERSRKTFSHFNP